MKSDTRRQAEARTLSHLSLHGETSFTDLMSVTGVTANELTRVLCTLIFTRAIDPDPAIEGYVLRGNYEWFGAPLARKHACPPLRDLGRVTCGAHHTAGFRCSRVEGHDLRHASSGKEFVLAVWVDGGIYDPAVSFTDAERRALDIDAAGAFFE